MTFRRLLVLMLVGFALALILGRATTPPTISHAQDSAANCDTLIVDAVRQVGSACREMGLNETCYGNTRVSATLNDDTLFFDTSGDIVPVPALDAIFTRPSDPATGEWGVALMDLQADLPEAADGIVRLVLFGGVDVEVGESLDAGAPICTFTNTIESNINMRSGPDLSYQVVDVLEIGETVDVYAYDDAREWVRSARGWVFASLGSMSCAGEPLMVVESSQDTYVAPMQSFTMQVTDAGACRNAPSGLLAQAPEGQTANIMVNGVEIRFGSTVFVAMPSENDALVVTGYDGTIHATAQGQTARALVGGQVVVPLADGVPSGGPSRVQPMSGAALGFDERALAFLPEAISKPTPLIITPRPGGGTGGGSGGDGPGMWLPCGSCDTCGHPAEECVTAPDGACLWDPATCVPGSAPPGVASLTVPSSSYNCISFQTFNVTATFTPAGSETVDDAASSVVNGNVTVLSTTITGAYTVDVQVYCDPPSTPPVSDAVAVTVWDTLGNVFTASFVVNVTP